MVFGNPVEVKTVTISALKNISGYILPPGSIEIWGGMDEKNLKLLNKTVPGQVTSESQTKAKDFVNTENLVINCSFKPTEIKFIKLLVKPVAKLPAWHAGKGEKAWIFVDEVFVN